MNIDLTTPVDNWFCSLSMSQRQHIANKISKEQSLSERDATSIWMSLSSMQKEWIQSHCSASHGMIQEDWQEGRMFSE